MATSKIILHFTSNVPSIFKNIQKHNNFINTYLTQNTNNQFFMEVINEGLIYFYDNLDIFHRMNMAIPYDEIMRMTSHLESLIDPEIILKDAITSKQFPQEGLMFFFTITCDQNILREVFDTISSHFTTVIGEGVEIVTIESAKIGVKFLNYSSFIQYVNLLCTMISGFVGKV